MHGCPDFGIDLGLHHHGSLFKPLLLGFCLRCGFVCIVVIDILNDWSADLQSHDVQPSVFGFDDCDGLCNGTKCSTAGRHCRHRHSSSGWRIGGLDSGT